MSWPAWAAERVEVVESDPSWPARGLALAAELDEVLSPWLVAAVEHLGSTAVPSLPAKPVLDLMAAVPDPDALVRAGSARLGAAGWVLVPPELDARPWRRFFVQPDGRGVRRLAHLHVMRPDEPRWAQVLAFRDRLRADQKLARRYAELKAALAQEHPDDRERYTEAKREFIEAVLERLG
ncbi:MAG: GrpB family protein [Pseudonocardiaceae bacterium]